MTTDRIFRAQQKVNRITNTIRIHQNAPMPDWEFIRELMGDKAAAKNELQNLKTDLQ